MNGRQKKINRVGDMHTSLVIDELTLDHFLNPVRKSLIDNAKDRFVNWSSELNIKRKVFSLELLETS